MTILLMVLRNISRHKVRAALGFFSVFLAAVVLHLYLGATAAMNALFSDSAVQGTLLVKARYGAVLVKTLPNDHNEKILQVPGVQASTPIVQWLAHMGPGDHEEDYVYVIGVDARQFRTIGGQSMKKLRPDVVKTFVEDETAVLTSRGVRVRYPHFAVGNSFDVGLLASFGAEEEGWVQPNPAPHLQGHVVAEIDEGLFSDRVIITHAKTLERTGWKRCIGLLVQIVPGTDPDRVTRGIEDKLANAPRDDQIEALLFENWLGGMRILAG